MAIGEGDRGARYRTASLVTLAVLGTVASLYLLKAILIPITLALMLSCLLSPATRFLRRRLALDHLHGAAAGRAAPVDRIVLAKAHRADGHRQGFPLAIVSHSRA